jgi:hypothetical protein
MSAAKKPNRMKAWRDKQYAAGKVQLACWVTVEDARRAKVLAAMQGKELGEVVTEFVLEGIERRAAGNEQLAAVFAALEPVRRRG